MNDSYPAGWLRRLAAWFDARLHVSDSLMPMLRHPIPRGAAGPMAWWYVFGSASMTLLTIQILTGVELALVYVPAADKAYESLLYLNYDEPLVSNRGVRAPSRRPVAVLSVVVAYTIVGVWIVFQPMQMRGMLAGGG